MGRGPWNMGVERPSDRAIREGFGTGGLNAGTSIQTVNAASSPGFIITTNNGDEPIYLLTSGVQVTSGTYDPSIGLSVNVRDGNGNNLWEIAGHIGDWPQFFGEGIPIPPNGGSAGIVVDNPQASSIDVKIAHSWREE